MVFIHCHHCPARGDPDRMLAEGRPGGAHDGSTLLTKRSVPVQFGLCLFSRSDVSQALFVHWAHQIKVGLVYYQCAPPKYFPGYELWRIALLSLQFTRRCTIMAESCFSSVDAGQMSTRRRTINLAVLTASPRLPGRPVFLVMFVFTGHTMTADTAKVRTSLGRAIYD